MYRRPPVIVSACAIAFSVCTYLFIRGPETRADDAPWGQMPPPNTLTLAEHQNGWQLLFDGKSTDGWRGFKRDRVGDGWQVRGDALVRADGGAGDIITTEQYENFDLVLEYQITKRGNSGLMFRVTEDSDQPWHTGPEIQIQDNIDGTDPQKSGWLYALVDANDDATRPVGTWNTIHLSINQGRGTVHVNGIRYYSFTIGNPDWNQRVAKSKFANYEGFAKHAKGHICLQDHGNEVAFRNIKIRDRDRANPGGDAPQPRLKAVPAFTNLQWTGWESDGDDGRRTLLRAVLLDHANDGSDRVFVGIQQGRIHVFKNDDSVQKTKIFLDIADRVQYRDRENEEGFLGLAFHPNYKDNGKFYVYYTTTEAPRQSLISEFTVRSDDPDSADPASERVVMRIPQPYWNHNGGTICFGPDGYLYVALGDGGLGNDPHGNGQNLQTLLGSVLRIDVNSQDQGGYGIPQDNPFVGRQDARGEIWAYGIRNPWRITFDRQTGKLWLGEVGQNLWEEINVITRGGNYGWNVRESYHPFAAHGADPSSDFVEPIFEYGHDIGKSITGGYVYRGKKRPELQGAYLYADYVSSRVWALHVDHQTGKVLRNEEIDTPQGLAIASFGEDEQGEVYFLTIGADGKAIYQFMPRE